MKLKLLAFAVFIVSFGVLTACQNTAQQASTEKAKTNVNATNPVQKTEVNSVQKTNESVQMDDAPRISLADAKKDFDAGTAIFIDTRGEGSFKQEHVKGAINIMPEQVESKYKEIPTGKKLIVYCS